jgi:molybdate transport system substrate-binding protein
MSRRVMRVVGALALSIGMGSQMAGASEISVLASAAIREAYLELVPMFEKQTGHRVVTVWAGTTEVARRIGGGQLVDLVIVSGPTIDKLTAEGKLVPGSRVDLVKSGIGVAVRSGQPKPDISSGEAVKKAVLGAKSVAYSSGPSGFYLAELFQKMGIADDIKAKVMQTPSGVQVGDVVARGEAELGFQQVSELLHVKGIEYVGPLPPDIQHVTVFSAGVHASAKEPEAAKALVKFLTAPDAASAVRKSGMEPG